MKMYIVVKDSVPLGIAVNAVAHASLICHLKYHNQPDYQDWLDESFKKVVCPANEKEFSKLKELENSQVITESSMDGAEVAIVLAPREEWPNVVKYLRLFK